MSGNAGLVPGELSADGCPSWLLGLTAPTPWTMEHISAQMPQGTVRVTQAVAHIQIHHFSLQSFAGSPPS